MIANHFSIKGKRKENEDFVLSKPLEGNMSVHIIADGMGGFDYGRLAAETVANTILEYLQTTKYFSNTNEIIYQSVIKANTTIKDLSSARSITLGCTIGGCLINQNKATIFWVGDVKIIHVRNNQIKFESEDHSLVKHLKRNGHIKSSTDLDSIRHVVTKSIKGEANKFKPDFAEIELASSDKILICSDGILENNKLTDIAKMNLSTISVLEDFKNKNNKNSDNSSLMVLEF